VAEFRNPTSEQPAWKALALCQEAGPGRRVAAVTESPPSVSAATGGRVYLRRCSEGECSEAVAELLSDVSRDALRRWLEPMVGPAAASALVEALATVPSRD